MALALVFYAEKKNNPSKVYVKRVKNRRTMEVIIDVIHINSNLSIEPRVSDQGVESLGSHFACLWRGFEFNEVKKKKLLLFFKNKMEILLHF